MANINKKIISIGLIITILCGFMTGVDFGMLSKANNENVSNLTVYGLTCEYNENPEVVDRKIPLLAWKLSSLQRTVMQTKYRITVSTSLAKLQAGDYDAWDSGEVVSDKTTAIEYKGELKSASDYYWQVFVWDNKGNNTVSETAKFGIGLLEKEDWDDAVWISHLPSGNGEVTYTVSMDFMLEENINGFQTAASIIFGAQNNNTYYMYQIVVDREGIFLIKPHVRVNGNWQEYENPATIPTNVIPTAQRFNTWHNLKIEYDAGNIKSFINNTEVDSRRFQTVLGHGRIGFRAFYNQNTGTNERAKYDDIKIVENGQTIYLEDFANTNAMDKYSIISGGGTANIAHDSIKDKNVLHFYPNASGETEFISIQKEEEQQDIIAKWTFEHDFQLEAASTGVIFGAVDTNNFYMWQIKDTVENIVEYRPHIYRNGNFELLGAINITSTISKENVHNIHTMKVEADNGTFKTYINNILIDTRSNMPFKEPGYIGARASNRGEDMLAEAAFYDNFKITSDDGTVLFFEDFDDSRNHQFDGGIVIDGKLYHKNPATEIIWQEMGNAMPYMRKDFETPNKEIKRAKIFSTALGLYEMFLNGERVGEDYFAPGWTDYDQRLQYQGYDVTGMIDSGKDNVFGVRLGHGWFSGTLGITGNRNEHYGKGASFYAKLLIEYTDGTSDVIVTDDTWKFTQNTPLRYSDILHGETYNATKQIGNNPTAWATTDVDTIEWEYAYTNANRRNLTAMVDPPVQVTDTIEPKEMWKLSNGNFIVDFGQNFAGLMEITLKGNRGDTVILKYGEVLNKPSTNGDVTISYINLREARVTDKYILGSDNPETFMPSFTFHGFRYAEIQGVDALELSDIKGKVIGSNLPITSTFESSSEMVNKLYQNILWGQKGNYLSIPTDCPQRDERLGWTGDAQVFVRTGSYNMDSVSFFTKYLYDVNDAQRADGAYPNFAPHKGFSKNQEYGASAWGDVGVVGPWTLYYQYGDIRIIEETFENMEKWVEFYRRESQNYSPALTFPHNNHHGHDIAKFGDWLNVIEDTDKGLVATAFFAYSTKLLAEMADIMAEHTDDETEKARYTQSASHHKTLFENIKSAYTQKYIDSDGKIGKNMETQASYVLSLAFDLVPENLKQNAADRLAANVRSRGHLTTGFVSVGRINPVLTEYGHNDLAYMLLTNRNYPSWGYTIDRGATTIWERWNSCNDDGTINEATVEMNSLNHYSLGAVGEWMFKNSLGIDWDTSAPGFKKFTLAPHPINDPSKDMTWAKGTYESINGLISSDWSYDTNGNLVYKASVPANTTATLRLPVPINNIVTVNGVSATDAEGVTYIERQNDRLIYTLESGDYQFNQVADPTFIDREPISVPTAVTDLVYNGNLQAGVLDGTGYTVTNGNATNAGTYTAVVTPDDNYYWDSGDNVTGERTVDFTIAKRPITITADSKSKSFGAQNPALTYKITLGNLALNDTLTGTITTSAVRNSNTGRYSITQGTLTNANNPNYNITFTNGTLTINAVRATAPTSNKKAGIYTNSVKVKLNSKISNARIHYTTNGKNPTSKSKSIKSGGTLTISRTTNLKFMVIAPNHTNSSVVSRRYTIRTATPNLKAVPSSKRNLGRNPVIKLTAPKGVTLYYTTNRKNPTTNTKTKVRAGKSINIKLTEPIYLRVIAVRSGCSASKVVERRFRSIYH